MNQYLSRLSHIGKKEKRTIIGLMSGTSLDGLDIAVCEIEGSGLDTKIDLTHFKTVAYSADFKSRIKAIFSRHDVDLEQVCVLNPWVAVQHAQMINDALKGWGIRNSDIDLMASHGQTIYHAPKILHGLPDYDNATLQIGDGDHLAVKTGIITISDFRQKHIAAGGEGAPLAVYGDYFIFGKKGEDRVMLNIGGIANFTFLPGNMDANAIFSTDTGTGNTLMDQFMQHHYQLSYDADARVASSGNIHPNLLQELKQHPFFQKGFPKTTGPELFNLSYLEEAQKRANALLISPEDIMRTLNAFSADTIVEALKKSFSDAKNVVVYSSGGGMHNPLLMNAIKKSLPDFRFYTTQDLAINPDAKEAVLFAILANETVAGGDILIGGGKETIPAVSMGKISFPG
jgi:anhydro-N-acetylmuramic acid kinase